MQDGQNCFNVASLGQISGLLLQHTGRRDRLLRLSFLKEKHLGGERGLTDIRLPNYEGSAQRI
jgi:hypothetical protein